MCLYSSTAIAVVNMAYAGETNNTKVGDDLKNAAFICVVCARFFKNHEDFCLHVSKHCNTRYTKKSFLSINGPAKEESDNSNISFEVQATLHSLYRLQASPDNGHDDIGENNTLNNSCLQKLPYSSNVSSFSEVQDTCVKSEPVENDEKNAPNDDDSNIGKIATACLSNNVKQEPTETDDQPESDYSEDRHSCQERITNTAEDNQTGCDPFHHLSDKPSNNKPHNQPKAGNADVLYVCDECGKAFRYKQVLQAHFVVHSNEMPYECSECGKAFKRKKGLHQHELTHTNTKPKDNSQKRRHKNERRHQCFKCDKSFKTKYELKRHVRRHSDDRPFQCAECKKPFKNKQDLTRHLLTHIGSKPHSCDECGKRFISRSKLKRHQLSHSDVRTHVCSICSRSFKMKSVLQAHVLTHSKEKIFQCLKCKKTFRSRQGLFHHNSIHIDKRPYSCNQRKKAFKNKNVVDKHQLIHDNQIDTCETCDSCKKTLKCPSSLHIKASNNAKNKRGKSFKKCFEIKGFNSIKDANKIITTNTETNEKTCTEITTPDQN